MNENNDWTTALEREIAHAEAIEERMKKSNLDSDTKDMIKQRVLYSLQLELLNRY